MKAVINIAGSLALAVFILLAPQPGSAQDLRGEIDAIIKDYLASHPEEVGEIVKNYMIQHPEAVGQIIAELLKHRPAASTGATAPASAKTAPEATAAIASNASELFSSPHQVTLGNPDGDVTLVEFFDYNCGFCKRALPDMLTLLKNDPKLKIVLKEFPILGPGSADAARVAVAVRMQASGEKYLAFHQALLGGPGPASKEKALAAAKEQGLDMARLERDMASDEVKTTLSEDMTLAAAVGIHGTPSYVIGKNLVVGAIGVPALEGDIAAARKATN
ncbi:MAG TPA: DsbA family protein [Xanthobacteraceae bacterium]|jgi:protein-disulfide isomerase|nr:DsbA family protein [Xanthobacteraceae bacterium]